jgi:hypothetical protein
LIITRGNIVHHLLPKSIEFQPKLILHIIKWNFVFFVAVGINDVLLGTFVGSTYPGCTYRFVFADRITFHEAIVDKSVTCSTQFLLTWKFAIGLAVDNGWGFSITTISIFIFFVLLLFHGSPVSQLNLTHNENSSNLRWGGVTDARPAGIGSVCIKGHLSRMDNSNYPRQHVLILFVGELSLSFVFTFNVWSNPKKVLND